MITHEELQSIRTRIEREYGGPAVYERDMAPDDAVALLDLVDDLKARAMSMLMATDMYSMTVRQLEAYRDLRALVMVVDRDSEEEE